MNQLELFDASDAVIAPGKPGRYQHAAILFTALGGDREGQPAHWPLPSTVQSCRCDCEDCEFLGHCSDDPCGFTDVLPDSALTVLEWLRDQQRKFGVLPDARFAWRRLIVGEWTEA